MPNLALVDAMTAEQMGPLAAPQPARGALDPAAAALLQAGFAGLAASGPSRTPVGLGQVFGKAGQAGLNTYQGMVAQQEQSAEAKRMKDAQIQHFTALAKKRDEEAAAHAREAQAQQSFQQMIQEQSANGQPPDEIGILGAGIKSGAFKANDVTTFMSRVMEGKAKREQRIEELRIKAEDRAATEETRQQAARERMAAEQQHREQMARLTAALRPARSQYVNTASGIMRDEGGVLSPATGPDGKPLMPPSSLTVDRGKITQAFKFRTEYNALPEVKSANDMEVRLKPVAEYGLGVAKGTVQENPTRDLELSKLYLMVTHPKGDRISNLDQQALRALPNLPRRVYESVDAVINGRTLDGGVRADMLRAITDRYRGLDAARQAKRGDVVKRAEAGSIPVDLIFGD